VRDGATPYLAGHEFSGVVAAVGEDTVGFDAEPSAAAALAQR
jgi:Zn-dependent alcohol dehydrogenase